MKKKIFFESKHINEEFGLFGINILCYKVQQNVAKDETTRQYHKTTRFLAKPSLFFEHLNKTITITIFTSLLHSSSLV